MKVDPLGFIISLSTPVKATDVTLCLSKPKPHPFMIVHITSLSKAETYQCVIFIKCSHSELHFCNIQWNLSIMDR